MGRLNSAERQTLIDRRTTYQSMLTKLQATYEAELEKPIEEYRFSSGEGAQQARRRKLSELREEMQWLESEIDLINRRLKGSGLVNLNMRRKAGYSDRSGGCR